jgi:phage tail P2-like protein
MNDTDYKIAEHLPSSIDEEPITTLASVVDAEIGKIDPDLLLIYPAIDTLDEKLIDYLAVQMHVDEYDDTADLEVKRQQVKQSFLLHRLKGTKYAVQRAVSTVYQSAKVEEWPEYSGNPYHFRVTGITAPMNETKTINKLVRLINAYKNTRSWLDYVQFSRQYGQKFLFGGNVNLVRKTTITFDIKQTIITQKNIYVLAGVGVYKEVTINGKLE